MKSMKISNYSHEQLMGYKKGLKAKNIDIVIRHIIDVYGNLEENRMIDENLTLKYEGRTNNKICKVCGIAKRNVDDGLCNKCFNEIENECKHTGSDWKEGYKIIKSRKKDENR